MNTSTYTFRDLLTFMESVKDGNINVSVASRFAGFIGRVPVELTVGDYHGHLAKAEAMSLEALDKQATLILPDDVGRPVVTYNVFSALVCDNCDDVHLGAAPVDVLEAIQHVSMFGPGVSVDEVMREDVGPGTTEERPANPVTRSMEELFGKSVKSEDLPDIPEDFDFDKIPDSRQGKSA